MALRAGTRIRGTKRHETRTVPATANVTNFPAGWAREALAAGGLEALTPDLPIEPGELWYLACLPCLAAGARTPDDLRLTERLEALVDEALTSDATTGLPSAAA
jgi:hypothetical protein